MSSIDRGEASVTPKFNGGATSEPIYIGNYAWGSLYTDDDLGSVTEVLWKAPFAGKDTIDVSNPGTLRTIRKVSDNSQLAAMAIAANNQYPIPADVFQCDWLVLVMDANVADDSQYRLFLKG